MSHAVVGEASGESRRLRSKMSLGRVASHRVRGVVLGHEHVSGHVVAEFKGKTNLGQFSQSRSVKKLKFKFIIV
jgi:hypothetical protein